jgi:glycosyltransferase involved in cell wall biosynthesis
MAVRFSIVVPTYNRARLITKAIDSVLSQTFTNWELVIVDDGSTDNTKEVVEQYSSKDKRIKYIYQQNAERSAARNNGIEHSTGEYICLLDSDDYFLPNRLELLNSAILERQNPVCMFYTAIMYDYGKTIIEKTELKNTYNNIFDFLLRATIGTPQACIHRNIFNHEKFNPQLHVSEDKELWIRIARNYPVVFLENQATVVATEHENRTVGDFIPSGYESNIVTSKYIFENFGQLFSSRKIRETYLHDGYMGLARTYARVGENYKMLSAIIHACSYLLFRSAKQKLFLIITNFSIFKPLLFFYGLIKGNKK